MLNKLKFALLLLLTAVIVFSCTKHNNDQPVNPVTPAQHDTLGAGWQKIQLDTSLIFQDIFFVNNQTGFVCGNNYIGKSTDGGLTWKNVLPSSFNGSFVNLFFTDANNGWAFGPSSFFLRTADGGNNWQRISGPGIFDGQFFDAGNGYLSASGALYKTADGGITLKKVIAAAGNGANGIFFLDLNSGWFAGTYLYKTSDSGQNFSPSPNPISAGEYAVQFTDSLHGWVAGGAKVYRTVDGGTTLETLIYNSGVAGSDIRFFDNNNGFILGNGYIYSTADGGKTLNQLCVIHESQVFEIHFTDMNHGWSAGSHGYIYRYVRP